MQYTHIIVATIVGFLFPLYALITGKKARLYIIQNPEILDKVFQSTGIILLTMCGLVIASMLINSTPMSTIGLFFVFNVWYVLALIVVCFAAYFIITKINLSDERLEKLKVGYKDVLYLMPENENQYNASVAVSVIAGVCEEIIFRGFLYWQLQQYMPVYAAFILTNVIFGLGHAGTKLKNAIMTFVLGILFSSTYVLTDSLWLAIALHIIVDFQSMIIGYKLKQKMAST